MNPDSVVVPAAERRAPFRRWTGMAAVALAGLVAATVSLDISGHWQGMFLLRGRSGLRLDLKDDLVLGDGSRLIIGTSFSRIRRLISGDRPMRPGQPWLELDWDEATGGGIVTSHLADGTETVTLFGRYVDSDGKQPHGLFVGGALPEVAADAGAQNESGVSYHDARGWHHVWCNVNEAMWDMARSRYSYPGEWTFVGSRVLIRDHARVVLSSTHEIQMGGSTLRMDRFAYFRAGQPWFKLGIRLVNDGEAPVAYAYMYGDEPWVGTFGSSDGNIGWVEGAVQRTAGVVDLAHNRWAGILDEKSGIANFIGWIGDDLPDLVYFANHPGLDGEEIGGPLNSNEVFIGLEWQHRVLKPGAARSMLLSLGLAARRGNMPRLPDGAGPL